MESEVLLQGEVCRYYKPPKVRKLPTSQGEPMPCILKGFDTNGLAYIHLLDKKLETKFSQILDTVESIYNSPGPNLSVGHNEISIGEILAALVSDPEKHQIKYIRGQVLEINQDKVLIMDIDKQESVSVGREKLCWMIEIFYNAPLLTIPCSMRFLELFIGSSAISEVARINASTYKTSQFACFYENPYYSALPIVELYNNREESVTRHWSINLDFISNIIVWNSRPLYLEKGEDGLILDKVKVTHALPNGHIWIQLGSGVMDKILAMNPLIDLSTVSQNEIAEKVEYQLGTRNLNFVIRFKMENKFYRASVLAIFDIGDVGEILVEFIDYGVKEIVHKNELLPFEYFGDAFCEIPPQAFRANLTRVPENGLTFEDLYFLTNSRMMQKVEIEENACSEYEYPLVIVYYISETARNKYKKPLNLPLVEFDFPGVPEVHKEPGKCFDFSNKRAKINETRNDGKPHWQFFK